MTIFLLAVLAYTFVGILVGAHGMGEDEKFLGATIFVYSLSLFAVAFLFLLR